MQVVELSDVTLRDLNLVGGKACSLGEMINNVDVRVPYGFVLTTKAFDSFMDFNQHPNTKAEVLAAQLPPGLIEMIKENYDGQLVAVRSSATGEDLPDASFAGQQDTYLNVQGEQDLLSAIVKCYGSLFNQRAISYRSQRDYQTGKLAIVIQQMVNAKQAGVAFSLDTESGFDSVVVINGSYGLGETVVSGQVVPDEYQIFKPTGKLISKDIGSKKYGLFQDGEHDVSLEDQNRFCLTDEEAEELGRTVMRLEKYYGHYVDVEWAFDQKGKLNILQVRPETTHTPSKLEIVQYQIQTEKQPIATGIAVGDRLGTGRGCYLIDVNNTQQFQAGDVLLAEMTNPDWEPVMAKASAIVTRRGGRTCHAAIVAREMGLPCIVGCEQMEVDQLNDRVITVSCAEGTVGRIYLGEIEYQLHKTSIRDFITAVLQAPVDLMLNVGNPDMAYQYANLPCGGVGLAREEFIISNYIGVHPRALLEDRIQLPGYSTGRESFVARLSHGMAKISAAFYPQPVIVRFSDFKTNEYRGLKFGDEYEPIEENPMIGWRGASRYYSTDYQAAFGMECEAVKQVREVMGLTNLIVMVPFVRTVDELIQVQKIMGENGLVRGQNGLQVYMMAEIPANIFLAEQFAELVDGFSIGSNDLTQTILATDRDNSRLNHIFDEMNPAVLAAIEHLIQVAHRTETKIGICGQGPSDNIEFARFLTNLKINSISVTPDSLNKTALNVGTTNST